MKVEWGVEGAFIYRETINYRLLQTATFISGAKEVATKQEGLVHYNELNLHHHQLRLSYVWTGQKEVDPTASVQTILIHSWTQPRYIHGFYRSLCM